MFKTYTKLYCGLCTIFILMVTGTNYLFLHNAGELATMEEIYKRQHSNPNDSCVYGQSIADDLLEYKLFNYHKLKPEIITIGSSRMLEFRENFFKSGYYNVGYTISGIKQAKYVFEHVLDNHKPQLVIMGLDFWWFNDNSDKPKYNKPFKPRKYHIGITEFFKPLRMIKEKKLSIGDYFGIAFGTYDVGCNVGIRGIINKSGLALDGSFYYTDQITGKSNISNLDIKFADTKNRIAKGINKFEYGKVASKEHIEKYMELVDYLKTQNIKIIFFFPPVAPEVLDYMANYEYSYIEDLKNKLSESGIKFFDFTDTNKTLETSACEFLDGFHPGDLLSARIIKYMVNKDKSLEPFVNIDYLNKVTKEYHGIVMIPDSKVTTEQETDFLNLGCGKLKNKH
jgi:hypothetical protein